MLRLVNVAVDVAVSLDVDVDVGAVVFIPLILRFFRIHDFLVKQFFYGN